MTARFTVEDLLAEARAALPGRPEPAELDGLVAAGALVVDIRTAAQRAADGDLPGALVVDRNVLEWRLDPDCPWRLDDLPPDMGDRPIVVVCNDGYSSSLAAANLQRIGLAGATDLAGGMQAWLRWCSGRG